MLCKIVPNYAAIISVFLCCVLAELVTARCPEGDYYDNVLGMCRSCTEFCRDVDERTCRDYCPGYTGGVILRFRPMDWEEPLAQPMSEQHDRDPTTAKKNGRCPEGDYWDPVMSQCSPCDSFCRAEENISCWRYCPDEARKRYPGQSCPDQRAAIAPFFDATDPWPTFKTGCKLESKLCNAGGCFCVNPSTGERRFGDLKVPPNERYNCKRKPRICLRERFAAWFKKQDVHVPSCDAKGFFEERQCNSKKCWTVKRTTGRRIKRNRRNKRVKRNKRRNMSK